MFIETLAAASIWLVGGPPDSLFEDLKSAPDLETAQPLEEDIWTSWLEGDSAVIEVIMKRALEAQSLGNLDLARDLYDRAIQIDPEYAEAYNRRATLFMSEDKLDEAILDLNEAIRLEPRHFGAWLGLAVIFEGLGAEKEALRAYENVLEIHPQSPQAKSAVTRLKRNVLGRGI